MPKTHITRALTRRQNDALWIVAEHSPTARELATHLRMTEAASRSVLGGLERRSLINRDYTTRRGVISYHANQRARDLLAALGFAGEATP